MIKRQDKQTSLHTSWMKRLSSFFLSTSCIDSRSLSSVTFLSSVVLNASKAFLFSKSTFSYSSSVISCKPKDSLILSPIEKMFLINLMTDNHYFLIILISIFGLLFRIILSFKLVLFMHCISRSFSSHRNIPVTKPTEQKSKSFNGEILLDPGRGLQLRKPQPLTILQHKC
jgi:hypothetical protein